MKWKGVKVGGEVGIIVDGWGFRGGEVDRERVGGVEEIEVEVWDGGMEDLKRRW